MRVTGARSVSSYLLNLLNICWYVLAIVLVVAIAILGLSLVRHIPGLAITAVPPAFEVNEGESGGRLTIPVSLALDDDRVAVSRSLGIDAAEIRDLRGALRFPVRGGRFFLTNGLLLVLMLMVALWGIRLLQGVLRTVRDGHPFVAANARRVRTIGWLVIGGEIARAIIVFLENDYARRHFSIEGLRFTAHADFSVAAIVEGLIILVIAEVFRAGTQLDEDQSLTV
jgi:hypothetical protein